LIPTGFYFILLLVGALGTAIFSAVFGVAGGMMLFVFLTLFLDVKSAIPIHAIVQSVSNVSRVVTLFKHINRRIFFRFCLLIIPGVVLGGYVFKYMNPTYMEIGIGISILIMIKLPTKFSSKEIPDNAFIGLGFLSGFLGMIVGVTGPLLSPFFIMKKLTKEEQVANKAACQFLVHLIKIPTFFEVVKFDFEPYYTILAGLIFFTVIGAWIGKNLISRISDHHYRLAEKIVLNVLAVFIIMKALSGYI
jgi:uncharacterized membrane protein YfcA